MFQWFKFSEFLSDPSEWHAFVIGWGDGISFHRTNWQMIKHLCPFDKKIEGELHYYKAGLALGRFSIVAFVVGMVALAQLHW